MHHWKMNQLTPVFYRCILKSWWLIRYSGALCSNWEIRHVDVLGEAASSCCRVWIFSGVLPDCPITMTLVLIKYDTCSTKFLYNSLPCPWFVLYGLGNLVYSILPLCLNNWFCHKRYKIYLNNIWTLEDSKSSRQHCSLVWKDLSTSPLHHL